MPNSPPVRTCSLCPCGDHRILPSLRGGVTPPHLEIFQLEMFGLKWSLQGLVEFKAERQALLVVFWYTSSTLPFWMSQGSMKAETGL